jgi:hypothetical protein
MIYKHSLVLQVKKNQVCSKLTLTLQKQREGRLMVTMIGVVFASALVPKEKMAEFFGKIVNKPKAVTTIISTCLW